MTRGMVELVVEDNDAATWQKVCPHCMRRFEVDERYFLSADMRVAIHVDCVLALAARPRESQADREYELRREALLTGVSGDDI